MLNRHKAAHRRRVSAARIPDLRGGGRLLRARFDAAQTTEDNRRHWSAADALSADSEASAEVRRTLRMRARYEVANNSYAKGIVLTLANDLVGTGPRLQMLTGSEDFNRNVERDFWRWSQAVRLAEKLRTVKMARCQDGEAFLVMADNPAVDVAGVRLDLQLIEADRVAGTNLPIDESCVDGIYFDAWGNPGAYRVLRCHPGDTRISYFDEAVMVPAGHMIHVFRQDRPGQHRGIPEITPALPLFAQLRRFTLAVLGAAEAAADFAGILYTDSPANGEAENVEPMDKIELERNMLLTMPGGWKMGQLEPKQPATTYGEFKGQILNEIARCLNMPFNVAAGNSSGYNYASGRLDHQTYYKAIKVDQALTASIVLDPALAAWLREHSLANGMTPPDELPHAWFWDGQSHVDPQKEAGAQETRLRNNTTTLAIEYAMQGRDWETEVRQRAREVALLRELGLGGESGVGSEESGAVEEDEVEEE